MAEPRELLPCPFCGSMAVHVRPAVYEFPGALGADAGAPSYYVECCAPSYYVHCSGACNGAVGPNRPTEEDARCHWNARTPAGKDPNHRLPCPFCGSFNIRLRSDGHPGGVVWIECCGCEVRGPIFDNSQLAREHWDTRR